MVLFLLGAFLSATVVYAFYWRAQQEAAQLEEEKQSLLEERQIVIDYMHTMVDAVGERLPREELFQRIVHAAILSTSALSACIFEKGSDNLLRGVAVEGLFPPHRPIPDIQKMKMGTRAKFIEQVLKSEVFPVGEGLVGRVAATGRGELITRAADDPRIVRHEDPSLAVNSVIAAPIMVHRRLIGVLCVCNPSDGMPFTETDYSLAEALAEQAGLAVHNADFLALQVEKQRLDIDLTLASDVQQMLLPRAMPVVPGLDIDARYLAAQKVSGDLYDVFELGEGRLGLAVADVSGKGISASLLMAIAGHERALLSRRDPSTGSFISDYVSSEGMPLGLVDAELFESVIEDKAVEFLPGSTLVLYTDGLTEAPNAEENEFGTGRLADVLRTAHATPAAKINDAILAAVQHFSGATGLRDDYTLLTVKRV